MNVLEVVKKLRVLSDPERNDNENQRKAARYKAAELMLKHGVTEADLQNMNYKKFIWRVDVSGLANVMLSFPKELLDKIKHLTLDDLRKMSPDSLDTLLRSK